MALITKHSFAGTFLLLALLIPNLYLTEAQIGVCYGRSGDNLPSAKDVINLCKSNGITRMRIYEPDQNTLEALRGSGIGLILGVARESLQPLGSDPSAANNWVQSNVIPYASNVNFRYIVVGNEINPSDPISRSILPAMQNMVSALRAANLAEQIKVSTAIGTSLVVNSYPPSNGVFSGESAPFINPILNFLKENGSPLFLNIYTYFARVDNPQIGLDYALFTSPGTVFTDPNNGLQYQNLFDALSDAVYAALDKAGVSDMKVHRGESGFPSDGGAEATPQNACTYYTNLINHVHIGTPRRQQPIETYLFTLFDEDLKQSGVEQHFGVFTHDMKPKCQLKLCIVCFEEAGKLDRHKLALINFSIRKQKSLS